MDPVSIVGVAAAALQFVDLASRIFATGWKVYRDSEGRSVEVKNLNLVLEDVVNLTKNIDNAARGLTSSDSHLALRQLLSETNSISEEIKRVLPKTNLHFQAISGNNGLTESPANGGRAGLAPSVGERFSVALEQALKTQEIKMIQQRLSELRTRITQELTALVWLEVRDSKEWERQCSEKLDKILSTLIDRQDGKHFGPEVSPLLTQQEGEESINQSYSSTQTATEKQIIRRIWEHGWLTDRSTSSPRAEVSPLNVDSSNIEARIVETIYYDAITHREDAIVNTFRSTYEWIFSHEPLESVPKDTIRKNLASWLYTSERDKSGSPFWITGKPGSGKSVLMKFIVNHKATAEGLHTWAGNDTLHRVSYYAWRPGITLGKTREGLLRSILYQVLVGNPHLTATICPRHWALFRLIKVSPETKCPAWDYRILSESMNLLLERAEELSIKLAIFIDGLDEFIDPPMELCGLIMELAQSPATKVCVASRPWPQFKDAFSQCLSMELHLVTDDDMTSYVFGRLESVQALKDLNDGYPNGGTRLLLEVLKRAQGVFLWVTLVTTTIIESLIEGAGLEELQRTVDAMPPELEGLYDAILNSIPTSQRPHMAVMLRLYDVSFLDLPWYTFWLADEHQLHVKTLPVLRPRYTDIVKFLPTLRRRISARTRGILECSFEPTRRASASLSGGFGSKDEDGDYNIECLHRTAAEWLRKPHVQDQLRRLSPEAFDPYVSLYHAELSLPGKGIENTTNPLSHAGRVGGSRLNLYRGLLYAAFADEDKTSPIVEHFLGFMKGVESEEDRRFWVQQAGRTCSTLGMIRFVRQWHAVQPADLNELFSNNDSSRALLKAAAFRSYALNINALCQAEVSDLVEDSNRLELIDFILSEGTFSRPILRGDLRDHIDKAKADGDVQSLDYYAKVEVLLQSHDSPGLRRTLHRLLKKRMSPRGNQVSRK